MINNRAVNFAKAKETTLIRKNNTYYTLLSNINQNLDLCITKIIKAKLYTSCLIIFEKYPFKIRRA